MGNKRGRPCRDLRGEIKNAILSSRIFNHIEKFKGARRRNLLIKDIANELGISVRKVEQHCAAIARARGIPIRKKGRSIYLQ
jgi:hypothetical protein